LLGAILRGPRLAATLLLAVLAGGTAGYMLVEGWNVWDAFYMTVTTVATVGYGEIHPLSPRGRLFTVALIFGGVGTALYTVTLLATMIVEGGLHRRLEQRGRSLQRHPRTGTSRLYRRTDREALERQPPSRLGRSREGLPKASEKTRLSSYGGNFFRRPQRYLIHIRLLTIRRLNCF